MDVVPVVPNSLFDVFFGDLEAGAETEVEACFQPKLYWDIGRQLGLEPEPKYFDKVDRYRADKRLTRSARTTTYISHE
jgi:hypothetical protein